MVVEEGADGCVAFMHMVRIGNNGGTTTRSRKLKMTQVSIAWIHNLPS